MTTVNLAMTRGDAFYHEIAYVDVYGAPIDLSDWTLQVDFKTEFSDKSPLISLSTDDGIAFMNDDPGTGVVILEFDASDIASLKIPPVLRPGYSAPFRAIYGDIKATPPDGNDLITDDGTRTVIVLRINEAVTS